MKAKTKHNIKKTVAFMAGIGASAIVARIVKNNVTPTNVIQKITIPLGAYALGSLAANAAINQMTTDLNEYDELLFGVKTETE